MYGGLRSYVLCAGRIELFLRCFNPARLLQLQHYIQPPTPQTFRSLSCFQLLKWAAPSHSSTVTATTPI